MSTPRPDFTKDNSWWLTEPMTRGYARRVIELAQLGVDAVNAHMLPVLPAWAVGTAEGR